MFIYSEYLLADKLYKFSIKYYYSAWNEIPQFNLENLKTQLRV